MSSFQGVGYSVGFTVYEGVLISGGWNRGVLLYIEMSSFRGLDIVWVLLYDIMNVVFSPTDFLCSDGCIDCLLRIQKLGVITLYVLECI